MHIKITYHITTFKNVVQYQTANFKSAKSAVTFASNECVWGYSFCHKMSYDQWDIFHEAVFGENTALPQSLFPGSADFHELLKWARLQSDKVTPLKHA